MENRISQLRRAQGLTLQQLADRVGTTNQQISHLEKGRRKLSIDWMERLAAALACQPFELLSAPPKGIASSGEMLTERERDLIAVFRQLDKPEQDVLWEALLPMIRFIAKNPGVREPGHSLTSPAQWHGSLE